MKVKDNDMFNGWRLAVQFLTVLPAKRNIPWNERSGRWSIYFYPVVGLLMGVFLSALAYVLLRYSPFSPLAATMCLFTCSIVLSGGLHLDGWMDVSDAFFSYQEKEKKLEIMKDSRVGAFGVMSLLFLLSWRFLFMYELVSRSKTVMILYLLIPLFSRIAMGLLLIAAPLAKPGGMAHFMKQVVKKNSWIAYGGYLLIAVIIGIIFFHAAIVILLALGSLLFCLCWGMFCKRQFGGITGDTLGACLEGTENILWLIGWLLLYFGTA